MAYYREEPWQQKTWSSPARQISLTGLSTYRPVWLLQNGEQWQPKRRLPSQKSWRPTQGVQENDVEKVLEPCLHLVQELPERPADWAKKLALSWLKGKWCDQVLWTDDNTEFPADRQQPRAELSQIARIYRDDDGLGQDDHGGLCSASEQSTDAVGVQNKQS